MTSSWFTTFRIFWRSRVVSKILPRGARSGLAERGICDWPSTWRWYPTIQSSLWRHISTGLDFGSSSVRKWRTHLLPGSYGEWCSGLKDVVEIRAFCWRDWLKFTISPFKFMLEYFYKCPEFESDCDWLGDYWFVMVYMGRERLRPCLCVLRVRVWLEEIVGMNEWNKKKYVSHVWVVLKHANKLLSLRWFSARKR